MRAVGADPLGADPLGADPVGADPVGADPVSAVAECTVSAVHRRDHRHVVPGSGCHPHQVEVVHLGARALAVCHDCGQDTGFVSGAQALLAAERHQRATATADVLLAL